MFSAKKLIVIKKMDVATIIAVREAAKEDKGELQQALKKAKDIAQELNELLPEARYYNRGKYYEVEYYWLKDLNLISRLAINDFFRIQELFALYNKYLNTPKVLEEMAQESKKTPEFKKYYAKMDKHIEDYKQAESKFVPKIAALKAAVSAYVKLAIAFVCVDPTISFPQEALDSFFFNAGKSSSSQHVTDLTKIFTSDLFKYLHDCATCKLDNPKKSESEAKLSLARP